MMHCYPFELEIEAHGVGLGHVWEGKRRHEAQCAERKWLLPVRGTKLAIRYGNESVILWGGREGCTRGQSKTGTVIRGDLDW